MESDVTLKFPYWSKMVVGSITYGNTIPFFVFLYQTLQLGIKCGKIEIAKKSSHFSV